jgi:PAS domain S-box-containing protein
VRNVQGETLGVLLVRYNAAILQQIVAKTAGLAGSASFAVLLDNNHMRLADGAEADLVFTTVVPLKADKVVELQVAGHLPRRPADQLSTNLAAFDQGLTNSGTQPFFNAELHATGQGREAVAVAPLTTEPWLVAFGQTESVFLAPVDQETRSLMLLGAIMIVFVVLAVAGGARLLTGPINRLTAMAAKVGAGDLSAQVGGEANDEIGKLAKTFNAMTAQLRQTLEGLTERTGQLRLANEQLQAELVERQRSQAALRESEAKYRSLVDEVNDGFYTSDLHGNLTFANRALARLLGFESPGALIGRNFAEFVPPGKVNDLAEQYRAATSKGTGSVVITTEVVRQDGTHAFIEIKPQIIVEAGRPVGNRGTLRDVTERRLAEEEIQRRLEELEAVNRVSTRMRSAQTLDELLPLVLDVTLEVARAPQGSIWLFDQSTNTLRPTVARGLGEAGDISRLPVEKPGEGVAGYVFATGQSYIADDFHQDQRLPEAIRQQIPPGTGGAVIPIRAANAVIGTLIVNVLSPRKLSPREVQLLAMLCEIAGNAIQRTQLHEQTEQRLRRLVALHEIDVAINASLDLQLTLNIFVDEAMAQLGVDAAAVILLDPGTQMLNYAVGRGFRTRGTQGTGQRPGEGNTGRGGGGGGARPPPQKPTAGGGEHRPGGA